jgi:hypothetical protein
VRAAPILAAALLVAAALAAPARADKVHLRGGGLLEGEVARTPDGRFLVRLPSGGEAILGPEDVEKVEPGATAHEEYAARLQALDPTDADGHYLLGLFCRDRGLKREAEALFRHVIRIVPDHEGAHAALGEVPWEGRWVPLEEALAAQGQVKLGARWVTPAEREAILREEAIRGFRKEVRRLAGRARSIDPATAAEAAEAIAAIRDPLAADALLEYARSPYPKVRIPCARALCRMGEDARVPPLLAALAGRDEDLDVRDAVAAALAAARIARVAEILLDQYVRSDEAWERNAAARALGAIRWKPAVPVLIATVTFRVEREALVPTDGPGFLVGPIRRDDPTPEDPFARRRLVLRAYRFQAYEYRVVEDVAFNDAARAALAAITGRSFDFDRPAWIAWWKENADRYDDWMRPVNPR